MNWNIAWIRIIILVGLMLFNTLATTPQMACMPVGRRVQTFRTLVLEPVSYTAHIATWDMIACTIYGARRSQC